MLRKLVLIVRRRRSSALRCSGSLTIPGTVPASALGPHTPNLDNGKTMFFAGGCASCHATPGQEDKTRLGGGLGLKSPFGTFYVPNISPDPNDGIGGWSEAQFVTAMVKGTSPDGRHYFPAFPYTSYQRMSTRICATCSPISRRCRRCRAGCANTTCRSRSTSAARSAAGSCCSSTASRSGPIRRRIAEWNRGAYLVNGAGHCAECHSPRNLLGGISQPALCRRPRSGRARAGSPTSPSTGYRPGRIRTSSSCLRPARTATATPSAARWQGGAQPQAT